MSVSTHVVWSDAAGVLAALSLRYGHAHAQTHRHRQVERLLRTAKKNRHRAPPLELEPKAIEILKATSSKLAVAHYVYVHCGGDIRESQPPGRTSRLRE